MNIVAWLQRQKRFSERAFGPGDRTAGILDHLAKELVEVAAAPDDLSEWIDIVTLAFDAAMRRGFMPEQVAAQLETTLSRNEKRQWPDWRTASSDEAIEHIREDQCTTRK